MPAILLNGTSSSGKTSIARAIQRASAVPFVYAAVDTFIEMFRWERNDPPEVRRETLLAAVSMFHDSLAALSSSRFPLLIDHVLQEREWYEACRRSLVVQKVLFVGVHCPLEVLGERERARGDRQPGMAEWQLPRVHGHDTYDVEVDTSRASPEECAQRIMAAFEAMKE